MEILASVLLRPHRAVYNPSKALGPSDFSIRGHPCRREDLTVLFPQLLNSYGQKLQCSWFRPPSYRARPIPCVVYCHGNCGNRLDAIDILEHVLILGMTVFAFDFAGSGVSDGSRVTLGFTEKQDISSVVSFLRTQADVGRIALWGRSMGASAALLYAQQSPHIAALVLDSPFASLKQASKELVAQYRLIPGAVGDYILQAIRKNVKKLAGFDMFEINPIERIENCDMPVLFIHSREDQLVSFSHSESLFAAYPHPDKTLIKLSGGHNAPRPMALYLETGAFLKRALRKPKVDRLGETLKVSLPLIDDQLRERIRQELRCE